MQRKQFQKMNTVVDNMEALLFDAHKTRGWQFVQEAMWVTWSLEKFGAFPSQIGIPTVLNEILLQ